MQQMDIIRTPNCYKVVFQYHPMLVKCTKRIPSARYQATGKYWEVAHSDVNYLRLMGDWAQKNRFVSVVRWLQDDEPVQSYEPLPMPQLTVPHHLLVQPYDYQTEGIAYALQKKRCIMGDEPGLGKSQPLDALIATPDGWKPMGVMVVGSRVFGRDGNIVTVTGVFPQGELDVYRVSFNDGSACECSLDHLWNVRDENRRRRGTGWVTKTLGEIMESGLYLKPSKEREESGRKPVPKWEIPMAEPVCYEPKQFVIPPYTMGAIIGDGFVSDTSCIEFSLPDAKLPIIDRIQNEMPDSLRIHTKQYNGIVRYRISNAVPEYKKSNLYMEQIRSMALNIGSKCKFIPTQYLHGSIQQRKELLNGLMDTDGSCIKNKTSYSTTSAVLAYDVKELVQSLGGTAKIKSYFNEGKSVEYRVNINTSFNPFSDNIYKGKQWKERGAYKLTRYITDVERVGKKLCQCIKVSAEDSLYITNSYIVTHNTAQAIGTMTASGAFPCLVICPASLKVNWQREFKRFGGIDAVILDDSNRAVWQTLLTMKRNDGKPLCQVIITNYESLKKFFVRRINRQQRFTLKSVEFDQRINLFRSVIIDESHKCKSNKTQQSKFVQGIAQGKEYILELTGTPVVNNNEDLIQQLNIMGRLDEFGGYTKFAGRYCQGINKSSHLKELNFRLRASCFFRRQKKDVLTQLPDKTRSYLVTDISNRKEYQDAERDVIKYLRDYKDADDEKLQRAIRGDIMVRMNILKQVSARGKVSSAIDIIHNTIDGGDKLIVFCFLKEVVAALKQEFPKAVTVTGDDNDRQKQYSVDKFQEDEACKLIILNYRSGGTGLTLTAASNVLFVEWPWTYSDCCQAEDRAHRNGQKNAVTCTYLLGDGTIDEYMYNLIQTKKNIANAVTGTDDDVQEKISQSDMVLNAAMDMFKGKY